MGKKKKLPAKVIKHLEKAGVKHELLEHKTVYTALDAAATMRKKFDEVAKSLLVKADKDYYVVLLPADHNLDMEKLKKVVGKQQQKDVKVVKIPSEKLAREVLKIRDDAMAAFGSLYKLPVIMEKKLEKVKKAVFSSDSYNHSVEMAVKDFMKLEQALVGSFGVKKKIKKPPVVKKEPSTKKKKK
ncbi:YbaK/EbsC family protein [bacterium]|nr:YbaK/EbsC family protein [bacterium]